MPRTLFTTDRLLARQITAADLPTMLAVYGDREAMRWVGDGEPLTAESCARWLEVTENNYRTKGYGMSTLEERASGQVVGFCGLVHPGGQSEAEIKYALLRRFWGLGLATEAARGMLAYGTATFGLAHIIATVALEHTASHHVLGKAGLAKGRLITQDDGSQTQVFTWQGDASSDTQP
ncbi:MAG: RimJ/RimL family protein N-acetyltransferase [Pseudohongiellaceae bacterium]|jgi:RimJ/RimL family protein N-acetyltransferase